MDQKSKLDRCGLWLLEQRRTQNQWRTFSQSMSPSSRTAGRTQSRKILPDNKLSNKQENSSALTFIDRPNLLILASATWAVVEQSLFPGNCQQLLHAASTVPSALTINFRARHPPEHLQTMETTMNMCAFIFSPSRTN